MRAPCRHLLAGLLLCLAAGASLASDIVVVVSNRSPITSLRLDQVAALFLCQEARFPDGSAAIPLDHPFGSSLYQHFYEKVSGKSPAMLKAYWSKMVFTGRGQPARDLAGSAEVRKAVAENPAMIGYIDRDALDPSVRPVLVIH
jgi:ABC-type phosphate transport system substrate-binding protein